MDGDNKKILGCLGLLAGLGICLGGILELQMREHFVQVLPDVHMPYWGLGLLLAIPATLLACWIAISPDRASSTSLNKNQTMQFFHAVFAVLAGVYLIVKVTASAPIGYIYLWGYLTGNEVRDIKARVVDSEPLHTYGKGCRQRMSLSINGRNERVCIEDRVIGTLPKPGQTVLIRGIVSPVGIWVKEVRADQ